MTKRHFLRHSLVPLPAGVVLTLRLSHHLVFFHFPAGVIGPDQLLGMKPRRFLRHSLTRPPVDARQPSLRLKRHLPVAGHETYLRLKQHLPVADHDTSLRR